MGTEYLENSVTRIELLYHIEQLTKKELEQRTDEQLSQLLKFLSDKHSAPVKIVKQIVQEALTVPVVKPLVHIDVKPTMTIAGIEYYGMVEVPEIIASQLRFMMNKQKAYETKTQQFIDHGVRDHGTIQ